MEVQLIQVPYDSAHRSIRMGAGPEHFVQKGLESVLRGLGHDVGIDCIEAQSEFRAEIRTTFELYRLLAKRVAAAYQHGFFPLVLSGNCGSAVGTVAGLDPAQLGIIWFDSHGDFNTPETTESGFLDGMGLAIAAGRCFGKMAASIPNFKPIPIKNMLHVGSRDFQQEERALFEESGSIVGAGAIRQSTMENALEPALKALRNRVSRIYLHFDLDVLDPADTRANEFAAPDGLTVAQIKTAIQMIGDRFTIAASGIASYDPQYDPDDEVLQAGLAIIKSILTAKEESC